MDGDVGLVIDEVDRDVTDPGRWHAKVRFLGHRLRVTLDVGQVPGMIGGDIPPLFVVHGPSLRAVTGVVARIEAGERVDLPLDLSEEMRAADPPLPDLRRDPAQQARLDAAADGVGVDVVALEVLDTDPYLLRTELVVDGRPVAAELRIYAAPGAPTITSWLTRGRDTGLTGNQEYAVERALLARLRA